MKTLIQNAHIFTACGAEYQNGSILFDESGIISVGTADPVEADVIVDGSGGWVVPGFIDAHSHLGMEGDSVGFESDELNESTDPVTPQLSTADAYNPLDRAVMEALEGGVTTVLTGPGSANAIGGKSALVHTGGGKCFEDVVIKAPAAMKFALGENPKSVYGKTNRAPVTRMATAALIRNALEKAKRYANAEDPDYDEKSEALLPVLNGSMQAHFHCHRADDIFTALRITKEYSLDTVIVHGTEGYTVAELLAARGVRVLSGPFVTDRSKPELRSLTVSSPALLTDAGVKTAIITDAPVIPQQYLNVCAALAVREGMKVSDALCAVTSVPAEILGVDNVIGTLQPGKWADLCLFDRCPLDIMARAVRVYVKGVRLV